MSIQEHLNKIRNAIYGREVRESIAKGIETAYDDASEKDNANMEVKIARGTHPNLRSRLEEVDNKQQQAAAQLAQKAEQDALETEKARIDTLIALPDGSTTNDARLEDIKVGADGRTYDEPSEHVRKIATGDALLDDAVQVHHASFIKLGRNLFDKRRAYSGYISASNGQINAHESYRVSDFERVDSNKDIVISPRVRHFLAYDSDKNPIPSTYVSTMTNNLTINTGDNIRYVRFNYYTNEEDGIQLEYGITPSGYQPYYYQIPNLLVDSDMLKENGLTDKVLFNFGDSIQAGDGNGGTGVGDIIALRNGMILHDWSKGGATIAWDSEDAASSDEQTRRQNIQYQVQQAIASGYTPDYILFNGMTNDINFSTLSDLGEISDGYGSTLDETTFSGGFETVVSELKNAFPDAHIIYIRPHIMASRNYDRQVLYGNQALDICEKWSIMPVDIFKYSGLNTFLDVHHKYTGATSAFPNGDRTHPNQEGYEKYYVPLIEHTLSMFK